MDLKFYKKKTLLHLVDHATRLSSSTVIASEDPEVVIKAIFKSSMSDNGGKFANKKFIGMCEFITLDSC